MISLFTKFPDLIALMSEREDGSMKLFAGSGLNLENRKRFFQKIGISKNKIIAAEIVHGNKVEIVNEASPGMVLGVDGLIAKSNNVFLSVTIADCIPVYFYEPRQKIIAIVHCGWRGIIDGVIENAMSKILELGSKAEDVNVAMGPGINACHFEIRDDVLEKFSNYSEFIVRRNEKIFIDLKGIIRKQLSDFNVVTENIEDNRECTMESDRYFSFRRDKPEKVEAMIAIIGIKYL
ncbi:MAG: hypothetical protein US25_C0030G0006 [Candidatus Moranbacteria bacterium GW2011_GWE1_36_7]|nr:MAG: hypothetical protein UR99_C0059G0003 [Candidatus Moranbacteria bacterium GW2011_GWD2_36_12]KKQ05073.1 MAG: hypothetical protein US16_C0039G0006 [Candidatus Moranbacteria bacterium GW2011_GWE2_36_40]KKQ14084.1 MAG: hypothetical protein US25_C0030G0006 [Candidatus Moranbacteria bacterium GW2011_GWE1_36_7]